jgi:hypothetical protein
MAAAGAFLNCGRIKPYFWGFGSKPRSVETLRPDTQEPGPNAVVYVLASAAVPTKVIANFLK